MNKRYNSNILFTFFILLFFLKCGTGSKGIIKLEETKYPVSLTEYLFDENEKVVKTGDGLKKVGKFEYSKTFWGIIWGIVSLSSDSSISDSINEEIKVKMKEVDGEDAVYLIDVNKNN